MASDRFRLRIVLRIALILAMGYAAIYVLTQTHFWLVSFWLVLFTIIAIWELIRYLERSKRELSNFLVSIQQEDFSTTYPEKSQNQADFDIHRAYNLINREFRKIRRQKESNYHYLQAVVEHTGVAMICYDAESQEIQLANKAAKELFNKPYLRKVENFDNINPELTQIIKRLKSGERELFDLQGGTDLKTLSIMAKELRLEERLYKLVSFQDIKSELEEQEVQSWQKLIRVLTHEIMNSAIPISTLISVINEKLESNGKSFSDLTTEDEDDLRGGLKTIENRSKGLIDFVESYKTITKLPKPAFEEIKIEELFSRISTLLTPALNHENITFTVSNPKEDLILKADAKMIEQVLINLITNAKDAVLEMANPRIKMRAQEAEGKVVITVADNGKGLDKETLENVFVPFFTTKKTGSGIGLSLSRQIMKMHRGRITVNSAPGEGAVFALEF